MAYFEALLDSNLYHFRFVEQNDLSFFFNLKNIKRVELIWIYLFTALLFYSIQQRY